MANRKNLQSVGTDNSKKEKKRYREKIFYIGLIGIVAGMAYNIYNIVCF